MTNIHPSAVIEQGAKIDATAQIGPFCYVSKDAKIAANVRLISHVTIMNDTTIGENTVVFPGAVLGAGPQDHGNEFNEGIKVIIGKNNVIRENVTIQAGTPKENLTTIVGNDCMFMVNSHVAHDCVVGNNVIMTNNAVIGGHVHLGDGVIIGGNSAVHQFVHIGRRAMIGGLTGVERDIIPFAIATGDRARLRGLNQIGLKRNGFPPEEIKSIVRAYMFIFKGKEGLFSERLETAKKKFADNKLVMEQIEFMCSSQNGKRKIMKPSND